MSFDASATPGNIDAEAERVRDHLQPLASVFGSGYRSRQGYHQKYRDQYREQRHRAS